MKWKKKTTKIINKGDYSLIRLSNGEFAKIDTEDLEKVCAHSWFLIRGYIATNIEKKTTYLHKFIMGEKNGYEIDHKNGDKSDNRKSNLRFCNRNQNIWNMPYKGYGFHKASQRWQVRIGFFGRQLRIGYYKTEEEAKSARKEAEKKYWGEYSFDNNFK